MQDFEVIGERLMLARRRKGITQARLSEMSGVTQRIISEMERGQRQGVNFATVLRLVEVLSLSLDELVGELEATTVG